MPKRYYWLKLKEDFFAQPKIKKLRRIAGGDTYTIIYLKMQLLSLKNEGRLFFEGTEDNFVDEIALTIDEDPENVSVTVAYLIRHGLLEQCSDDEYSMPQAIESIGSEADSTRRMRAKRERDKALLCDAEGNKRQNVTLECNNVTQQCYIVQKCDTEIEKETDKDKHIESDINTEGEKEKNVSSTSFPILCNTIQTLYNDICTSYPKCTSLSESRKKAIRARLNCGYTVEHFKILFQKAEASGFLKGRNDRNWRASFDWLVKDSNMAKVLDGNYDNWEGENHNGRNVGAQAAGRNPIGRFEEIPGGVQL